VGNNSQIETAHAVKGSAPVNSQNHAIASIGVSDPNPRIGCVLVHANGALFAAGHTHAAGGPHAEIMALRAARAAGHDVRGATAYVTLEPCSHHGRTPPCCDALIEAGIAKVVVAIEDPNPLVAGRGIAKLRAAGIEVEVIGGEWGEASRELNIGFFSRMIRGRPWVRLKVAASLDGRTALDNGASQWITGETALADGHAWRKRAGAVLTGIGTVREDDPRLDVRLVPTDLQPLRVVVDSRLDIAPSARVLQPPGRALVYTASDDAARMGALAASHIEVARLPADAQGKTDLVAMLADLARREVNELHVEAGEKLNASLLREGLVDELLVYIAPRLLGPGHGIAAIGPLATLADSLDFEFVDVERVGADLRLRLRPPGRAVF
jgi:diaminohydroxyphosphoribosylaminopyrimidine deaminase/5-amino-6-(5-phosphoribosylamino)uracil reductase